MIANDKCKTFEDTEVDVIYQRFCCLCESETYEIKSERLFCWVINLYPEITISVCIMVCALSYFRDEHPLLPFISDSIATLICSAVVSQNKWVKIIM